MPLAQMAEQYISGLMQALKTLATRKKHANTLAHIQGYFSKHLQGNERQELTQQIHDYREGLVPLNGATDLNKTLSFTVPERVFSQTSVFIALP